jgi:hypothetical protein
MEEQRMSFGDSADIEVHDATGKLKLKRHVHVENGVTIIEDEKIQEVK